MSMNLSDSTINLKTVTTQANSADPLGSTRSQVRRVKATAHPTLQTNIGTELVQFSLPFTREECTSSSEIRAFAADGVTEIPIYAENGLPSYRWDGKPAEFIRNAIVTVQLSFADKTTPIDFYVEWGAGKPTNTLPAQPRELNWIDYRDSGLQYGKFDAVDASRRPDFDFQRDKHGLPREEIMEPRTWVTLPKEYLRYSEIATAYSEQGTSSNQDFIDSWNFFKEAVETSSNANGTHVKEKQLCPYQFDKHEFSLADTGNSGNAFEGSGYAVWLADRASVFVQTYIMTGELKDLVRAHRNCYFYNWRVVGGIFMPKMLGKPENDGKYLYSRPIISNHLLTGTDRHFSKLAEIETNLINTVAPIYENKAIWTEREASVWLNNHIAFWEYTGSADHRQTILDYITHLYDLQQTPMNGWAKDGSFRHSLGHHEGFGGEPPIGSPWMSNLLVAELVRYFEHSLDNRVLTMLYDLSQFVSNYALYWGNSIVEYVPDNLLPKYLASVEGQESKNSYEDGEHSLDVLRLMARGRWAADILGHNFDTETVQMRNLLHTQKRNVEFWTRTSQDTINAGYPTYRVNPYRKFNWVYGSNNLEVFKLVEDL